MTRGGRSDQQAPIRRRRCAACGAEGDRSSFLRVVRQPDGSVVFAGVEKTQGRSAYICRNIECVRIARKKNSLSRALKQQVPSEVYDMLDGMFDDG